MIQSTPAIVLSRMNYSDSGLIVRVYTKKYGLLSLLEKGVRAKKNKKTSLFQPFMILDLVLFLNEKRSLHYTKEVSRKQNLGQIHTNMVKTSLSFFIAELIYKSINEREENQEMYNFLENSILFLDATEESVANFHLVFMLKYASLMGFGIENPNPKNVYFDLEKGVFASTPTHSKFMNEEMSQILSRLLKVNYLNMNEVSISNRQRSSLVESLLDFFYIHNEGIRQLNSKEVLDTIFR